LLQKHILRSIFNNRNPQTIIVSKIARLLPPLGDALDLLNLLNFKTRLFSEFALDKKGNKDGPLRVGMYAAAGAALEGGIEEGSAR
jgi:hypothetical protein